MADEADLAALRVEQERAEMIRRARKPLPPRNPGECQRCGEDMPHLVGGKCVPCSEGRWRE